MRKGKHKDGQHKEGDIDPATGAIWKQFSHGRWELQCPKHGIAENNSNLTVQCLKHWRKNDYKVNHTCKFLDNNIDDSERQTTITDYYEIPFDLSDKPLLTQIALAGAKSNASSKVLASKIMIWLYNQIYQYAYSRGKDGKPLENIEFSEKEISNEINNVSTKLHDNNINIMKSTKVVSAVVDAGTVRNHHNLEIMITAPGLFKPFLYQSIPINEGTKEEYQRIITNLHNELLQHEVILAGVCGDNLAAQKNGIDHTNPSSIQSISFEKQLLVDADLQKLIEELKVCDHNLKDELNQQIKEKSLLLKHLQSNSALLYNPCVNHVLNLAFNDILNDCYGISKFIEIIEKFNEFLKEKPIKRHVGKIQFSICRSRWIYLFENLLQLYKSKQKLKELYDKKDSDNSVKHILEQEKYEIIRSFPEDLCPIINILWPLHSFSIYVESNSTLLCDIIPTYNKLIGELNSRGNKYNMEHITNQMVEKLNNRFHNTARWDLLMTAYALSPYGRKEMTSSNYNKISPYSPHAIKFFEINEIDSRQDEGDKIKKFRDQVHETISIEEDTYDYFAEQGEGEIDIEDSELLNDDERKQLKEDLLETIDDAKYVGKNLLSDFKDVYSFIRKCGQNLIEDKILNLKDALDKLICYFDAFENIFRRYSLDYKYPEMIKNELKSLQEEIVDDQKTIERIDSALAFIQKIGNNKSALNISLSNATRNDAKIDQTIEDLDVYSDEFTITMNLIMQNIQKDRLWQCSVSASSEESSEDNSVILTIQQIGLILGMDRKVIDDEYAIYMKKENNTRSVSLIESLSSSHPLKFWHRIKKSGLEHLAEIAIRILSISPSEAECERMISKKRRIITKYHTNMSNKAIQSRAIIMSTDDDVLIHLISLD